MLHTSHAALRSVCADQPAAFFVSKFTGACELSDARCVWCTHVIAGIGMTEVRWQTSETCLGLFLGSGAVQSWTDVAFLHCLILHLDARDEMSSV